MFTFLRLPKYYSQPVCVLSLFFPHFLLHLKLKFAFFSLIFLLPIIKCSNTFYYYFSTIFHKSITSANQFSFSSLEIALFILQYAIPFVSGSEILLP